VDDNTYNYNNTFEKKMNTLWISNVGFLFGLWCGIMLAYMRLRELSKENEECWNYITELEDDLNV